MATHEIIKANNTMKNLTKKQRGEIYWNMAVDYINFNYETLIFLTNLQRHFNTKINGEIICTLFPEIELVLPNGLLDMTREERIIMMLLCYQMCQK